MSEEHPAADTPVAATRSQSGLSVALASVGLLVVPALIMAALKWLFGW